MESLKEAAYSGHGMQVAELISQQAEPEIVRAIISEVSHESIIAFL